MKYNFLWLSKIFLIIEFAVVILQTEGIGNLKNKTSWTKKFGWHCDNPHFSGLLGSLREAKYRCTMDNKCVAISDFACDDFYYGLCLNDSNIINNNTRIQGKKDCIYIKPGKI